MLSSRSAFDLTSNRFGQLLRAKRETGSPLIDLTLSNPTRAGFGSLLRVSLAALASPVSREYDPDPRGRFTARSAVSAYYRERGVDVDPDRILLTASTSEAYGWLFKLLCDHGDEVLAPVPSYPLFNYLAGLEGVRLVPYHLQRARGFTLDLDAISNVITDRTRAILLVSPNNPTGSVIGVSDLATLDELAARTGIAIISDEVFADFPFPGATAPVVAAARARRALTFSLSGLSKVCGLPQLKLGWVVIGGDDHRADAWARLELIADTYLSVSTPIQLAAGDLLANRQIYLAEINHRIASNRATLAMTVANHPGIELLQADGGWYACLRVPRIHSEEELALMLLRQHNVVVHPGYFFDFPEEAWLVTSLIVSPADFREGIGRVITLLAG